MPDDSSEVGTAATATVLSAIAGLAGGPAAAAAVGFIAGLPAGLVMLPAIVVTVFISPITAVWLGVCTATMMLGFFLGAIRKPPPGFFRALGHSPASEQIAALNAELSAARDRELALVQALADAQNQAPPEQPAIEGKVWTPRAIR